MPAANENSEGPWPVAMSSHIYTALLDARWNKGTGYFALTLVYIVSVGTRPRAVSLFSYTSLLSGEVMPKYEQI